ncbi:MAG: helix-turn-helix domain-containing protein [Acidimicrobiales bacterium]
MPGDVPIPGSTRAKLIEAGMRQFSGSGYDAVEVDRVAEEAGVTVGALYHHFLSKKEFFGTLRDDLTRRVLDRTEAVAETMAPRRAAKAALLAAFDAVLRIGAGRLLTERDPRGGRDALADYLAELAVQAGMSAPRVTGVVLAASLRAALDEALQNQEGGREEARKALEGLLA